MVAVPVAPVAGIVTVDPAPTLFSVTVNVSANSAMLSLINGMLMVCVAPLSEPAGKVTLPVVAV
ncbi:hypothetical protein D3C85_1487620 [compost metagenome]